MGVKFGDLEMKTKRILAITLALFLALTLAVSAAFAASVHLKGGRNAKPSFTDLGVTLNAMGELAGLGNGDVLVTLDATAAVTASCINPGTGEHRPPGQNPAPITVTGSQAIPQEEIKNGNTPFNVTTQAPASPIPGAPDCPNTRWMETIDDLAFTSATITVEQPAGTVVLIVACTFASPTMDGPVPNNNVSCTQTQP